MVFIKISQNSQENTWVSFLIKLQASGRPEVFSCEFCGISKSTCSTEHLRVTASEHLQVKCRLGYKYTFLNVQYLPLETCLGNKNGYPQNQQKFCD